MYHICKVTRHSESGVVVTAVFRELESLLEKTSFGVKYFLLVFIMKGNKLLLLVFVGIHPFVRLCSK